jgi:HPt (histidine-containing phosphotransfer) domain-containing protein
VPNEEVSPVNAPINTQVNPADRPTNPWESIIELVAEEVIEETLTETNLEITPEANLEVTNTNIEAIVEVIEENTKENLEPVSTNQSDLISNPVDANAIKAIDDANSTDIRNSEPIFSDSQTCEPLPTEALVDSVNATDSPVNLEDFSIEIPEKSQNIEDVEVLENLTEHTETTEVSDNPQAVTTDSLNEQLLEEKANSEIYIDQGFANSSSLVTSQNGLPHLFLASQPTEQQQDEVVEEALGEAISESTSQSISKATFLELTVDDEQDEEREPAIETQFIETILTIAGNGQKAYDFLIEVIDDYLDETPRLVQAIDKALAINDQVKLLQLINSLRTSSDYVGALTVSYQCRQLESAVRANYVVLIYASLSQVAIEVQRATDALRLERSRYVK